ncbi:MAG: xylose isomerase [Alphaproteobacteria bacterium]|nr:MAG: xylose isomerase [Alphaproteobacteria bacterium]
MTHNPFADMTPIAFEGPDTANPLAYRYYDPQRQVLGRSMADHLRIAVCYWHSFCWDGTDTFGGGTFARPWPLVPRSQAQAAAKLDAAFGFIARLGVPFFCFHDVDAMAAADTAPAHARNLAQIVDCMEEKMAQTGIRLLWGTANLFSHPRYMAGAATNPDPDVFAFAAFQVRQCLDATHRLGGENYVLWGGREGYDSLLNTDIGRELDQMGRFLNLVVDHKHKIGFPGTLLIEPKPHEPTKHQYDHDVATVYGFLKRYGLEKEIKVNIEVNHATLAGHSFEHEIATAAALDILGSIDANRGDPQNGWDTDQFPNNAADLTVAMYYLLKAGGLSRGGFNFDAKLRRQSIDLEDLFHAHIGGIDTLARALLNAAAIIEDGTLDAARASRYEGWKSARGRAVFAADASLSGLADRVLAQALDPRPVSGRQEKLENLINRFV